MEEPQREMTHDEFKKSSERVREDLMRVMRCGNDVVGVIEKHGLSESQVECLAEMLTMRLHRDSKELGHEMFKVVMAVDRQISLADEKKK
jgi:hypothetical protein